MTQATVDPNRCPVCGLSNQCAMQAQKATGLEQPPCWCTRADFSPELLASIAPGQRGLACICARCAQAGAAR